MSFIVDVDGTVADCSHRLHWIKSKPKNWKAFYAGIEHDKPIAPVVAMVRTLDEGCNIVFCSGRPEDYRDATQKWLDTHVGVIAPLYMRPKGDYRSDDLVKLELLERIRTDGYDPRVAFDDRKRVKKMWVEQGIFVFDVNQTDTEF